MGPSPSSAGTAGKTGGSQEELLPLLELPCLEMLYHGKLALPGHGACVHGCQHMGSSRMLNGLRLPRKHRAGIPLNPRCLCSPSLLLTER